MAVASEPIIAAPAEHAPAGGLRRELSVVDAAAFSTGILGPVGAMALLGTGAAGLLGKGATWAFLFALIGVSLVAYAFIQLSKYVQSAGSVYALVGVTLGPRAGFVAGWALFGAYIAIGAGAGIEIALFFSQFLSGIGVLHSSEWIVIALIALGFVGLLTLVEVRVITRGLLTTELLGVVLVTILSAVIIIRLLFGHGPHGQTFNFHFLALGHGTGVGTIASAAVFGFLAFAGFEGAAALGEETVQPARDIPRAFKVAVTVVGSFYVLTIIAQTLGYGTNAAGVSSFQKASSPYGALASSYVGPWLADVLNIAASLSLFAILLATTSGAARILYALARDAGVERGMASLSRKGEPVVALGIVIAAILAIMIGQRLAGCSVLNATFYALTIGTLALLVAYLLATLGAVRFLFLGKRPRAPRWQIVIPLAGAGFVVYTIYKNVIGVEFPYTRFPYIVAAWLVVAILLVISTPNIAARVRARLAQTHGEVG